MSIMQIAELLYPDVVRDTIIEDTFYLTPTEPGKLIREYRFKPGMLAYMYIFIDDFGKGIGKYVKIKAQKFRGEQPISKPTVHGSPYGMYHARAFSARGVNPGLVEYDPDNGIYAIQCEFRGYQLILNSEYKIIIQYPRREDIKDPTDLANYGSQVYIEAYIACKEVDLSRFKDVVNEIVGLIEVL